MSILLYFINYYIPMLVNTYCYHTCILNVIDAVKEWQICKKKHRTYILIIFMDYDMTCFNFMLLNEGFQSLWILVSLCTCTLFCFQIPMWRMNHLKNYLFYSLLLMNFFCKQFNISLDLHNSKRMKMYWWYVSFLSSYMYISSLIVKFWHHQYYTTM